MHRLSIGIHELHTKLLEMGEFAEVSLTRSVRALAERDRLLADQVLRDESRINQLEMEIDSLAVKLIALHQPVACDLRFITAALKINTDLERIGDLAVTIARRSIALLTEPPIDAVGADLQLMANLTIDMLSRSLSSLLLRDAALALEVLRSDDEVDFLLDKTNREILQTILQEPAKAGTGVDLILVSRSLERIADHATNIAEDIVFLVFGKDVRHRTTRVA